MLKFKKGDEVIVTGFINSLAEELGTLGEVGIVEVADDSEIPYFVKLESVKGGSGGLWFKEENLKSAKESTFYKGVVYSVGDVIERLDDYHYPLGSKHTIIRMHHIYEDCVVAVDEDGEEGVHALVYVKKVIKDKEEDMDNFEKHNPELQVGDEVLILEHPVLVRAKGINYPESMQKEIGSKHEIVEIHENGYRLSNHWSYEAKYLQKVVNDVDKSQILKQEIEVGDLVTLISLENTRKEYGIAGSMKKVGESFIVKHIYNDEEYGLIEVIDDGEWSYDHRDLVLLQKSSDMKERKLAPIDLKLHTHTSFDASTSGEADDFGDFDISPDDLKGMVDDMISHPIQPIESDGGSSDYYFTKLPKWLIDQIVETGGIEVKDIVQFVFDNDAHAKDIIKAQKRIIEQRKGGGKVGLKPLYDYNKIVFFAEDQLRVAKNNLDEKSE